MQIEDGIEESNRCNIRGDVKNDVSEFTHMKYKMQSAIISLGVKSG